MTMINNNVQFTYIPDVRFPDRVLTVASRKIETGKFEYSFCMNRVHVHESLEKGHGYSDYHLSVSVVDQFSKKEARKKCLGKIQGGSSMQFDAPIGTNVKRTMLENLVENMEVPSLVRKIARQKLDNF